MNPKFLRKWKIPDKTIFNYDDGKISEEILEKYNYILARDEPWCLESYDVLRQRLMK